MEPSIVKWSISLDKDEDIEKIGGAMALFDAHEQGEELNEEQLEFVSGENIFKKIWFNIKHTSKISYRTFQNILKKDSGAYGLKKNLNM